MGSKISNPLSPSQRQDLERNLIFLEKEKKLITPAPAEIRGHLRCLQNYYFDQNNQLIVDNKGEKLNKLQNIENTLTINYWNLLSQLLEGIFQMHQQGFIGRCISYETLYYHQATIIFGYFGYFHELRKAPENCFLKFTTFETDLWLVGEIIWQTITRQQLIKSYTPLELNFNFEQNDKQLDPDLYLILRSILQKYQSQRIPISQLLLHPKLNFDPEIRQPMLKFYENYDIKYLLLFWKNSIKRDFKNKKLYFYRISVDLIKYFYQIYVQIQLLNFAFHLSFLFPNKNEDVLLSINRLIIQKMYILSKQLKYLVLTFQIPEYYLNLDHNIAQTLIFNSDYSNLQTEILAQHSELLILKQSQTNETIDILNSLQDIDRELKQFETYGNLTMPQFLLLKILNNSSVKNLTPRKFKCLSLEEIFKYEIQSRLI